MLLAAAVKPYTERADLVLKEMTAAHIGDAVLAEHFKEKYEALRALPDSWGAYTYKSTSFCLRAGRFTLQMSMTPTIAVYPLQYSNMDQYAIVAERDAPQAFAKYLAPRLPDYEKTLREGETLTAELDKVLDSCKTLNKLFQLYPSMMKHADPKDLAKISARPRKNQTQVEQLSDVAKGLLVKSELLR